MTQVHVTTREGEVITDNGIDEVLALCGGMCSCATCHVYIDSDHKDLLPAIHDDEDGLLSISDHRKENSRLACQVRINESLNGLRVTVAPAD
jgi:2Fe-2S ferredoxin